MRTQHIVPQQTNLNQHGYGLFNPDQTNLVQQQQHYTVQINSTQQQQDASRQQNVQGYHNSALLMRRQPRPQTQYPGYCQEVYSNHDQAYTERSQNDQEHQTQSWTESDPLKRQKTEDLKIN